MVATATRNCVSRDLSMFLDFSDKLFDVFGAGKACGFDAPDDVVIDDT